LTVVEQHIIENMFKMLSFGIEPCVKANSPWVKLQLPDQCSFKNKKKSSRQLVGYSRVHFCAKNYHSMA